MYYLRLITLVLLIGFTAAQAAPVREVHLGISPFLAPAQRDALVKALPAWLLDKNSVPAGTRIVFSDAWSLVVIADITIPTLEIDTPRSRTPRLADPLAVVGRWLRSPAPSVEGIPADSAAVRAPEWLFDASTGPAANPRIFIILGSPLYSSPAEPTFDMTADARYPSDGHLALGLRDSPFGLAEKKARLRDATVQWCYFDGSFWANELHRHVVTRFWSLFIQGQSGSLTSFSADLPATLAHSLQAGLQPVLNAQPDPEDQKPMMHSARPRNTPIGQDQAPVSPAAEPKHVSNPPVIEPAPVVVPVITLPAAAPAPPVAVVVEIAPPLGTPAVEAHTEISPAPLPNPVSAPTPIGPPTPVAIDPPAPPPQPEQPAPMSVSANRDRTKVRQVPGGYPLRTPGEH